MNIKFLTLCFCLLVPITASADVITVPTHMVHVANDAVNGTTNPLYDVANAFDGILNKDSINGAIFDLSSNDTSRWLVNFIGVTEIESVLLHQKVGGLVDNGIKDFSIRFFSDSNGAGSHLHTQFFFASLNSSTAPEVFALSSNVTTPGSMIMSVTTSYGDSSVAEFSELQFVGTAVPEPGSIAVLVLTGLACLSRRRRRA